MDGRTEFVLQTVSMSNRRAMLQVWLHRSGQNSANDEIIIDQKSVLRVFFSRNNPNELIAESTITGST